MADEALKTRLNNAAATGEWAIFTSADVIPADWIRTLAIAESGHPKGLNIKGASIKGRLDFEGCTLPRSLFLSACTIADGISLDRAKAVVLGFQDCPLIGGIEGGRLKVDNSLFLRRSTIEGRVFLIGAKIGGNLALIGAALDGGKGNSLEADGLEVGGDLLLSDKFSAKGPIRLLGAKIGGVLSLISATLDGGKGKALIADRLEVKGGLFLRGGYSAKGVVDLNHATIGVLVDEAACWPDLILTGLTYDSIGPDSPQTAEERLLWLGRRQNTEKFDPQPYEQLAKVLKAAGHAGEARRILIEKERDYARRKRLAAGSVTQWAHVIWLLLMDKLTRHGYEPWQVLPYVLTVWMLGWAIYSDADRHYAMVPAKERVYMSEKYQEGALPPQYPRFNAFIYSADVFFPFVDLHQESEWRPATEKVRKVQSDFDAHIGWIAKLYTWVHIALGWFLSGIGVAAVTGLVKRD